MAAIQRTRISSSVVGMFVVAVGAALVVGGTGGYLLRGSGAQDSGQAVVAQNAAPRAAAELPEEVQNYQNASQVPAFKVDQMLDSLDYAPSVRPADLPLWVQRYMSIPDGPQFKVDPFIETLDYAKPAELPAWVQQYTSPAPAPQFKIDKFIEDRSL